MTRVNAGVHPRELHRRHLIAEYREIPMVPASLRRSLRTKPLEDVLKKVPATFTLNRGHVLFFIDKLEYLSDRYELVKKEMEARGYSPDPARDPGFKGFDARCYGRWAETGDARAIVLERIAQRKAEKPHLYT